jgi:glycosyltransferase involved in cell wall biosynthesis
MKDEEKVSVIIPGFRCHETICRTIDSVQDQDYKNVETVVVLNGEWNEKDELVRQLGEKYGDKISVMSIKEPGLGNAQNLGFKISHGDIILHLLSDNYLMPGALRTYMEALREHPECGFAYSGYRFISDDPSQVYMSNPFSLYHLKCENYIDGCSPYRRKFAPRWSTELKSLIDWDAMLQIAEKTPGFYITEPTFYAEMPKPGGLSDDSNRNWIRRWKAVRELHNVPDRVICIASLDEPQYALRMAELLECDFRINPGFKPHEYRLIYAYSFNCSLERIQYNSSMFMRHLGHKLIHWIGSDLRELLKLRWIDVDYFTSAVLKRISENWCMNFRDQDLLRKMGLTAEIVYPAIELPDILPEKSSAISVNDPAVIDQLRKAMPDLEFRCNDVSCGISVHHEDHPENIVKMLCAGNVIISTTPMAGVNYVQGYTNVPELRKMLVHAIRKVRKDGDKAEQETVDSYRAKCNPKKMKERLMKIAEKHIQKYGRLSDISTIEAQA